MIRVVIGICARLVAQVLAAGLLCQAVSAAPLGGDFVLESSAGTVSLTELRGKVVPLYFGYMSCPDICPITLNVLGVALASLEDSERRQVQALFVSLDPERDAAEALADYAQHFHPSIKGVTGSADAVADVANRYRVRFARVPSGSDGVYTLDHTSRLVLIDRQGQMRQLIPDGTPSEQVAMAIRALLAE